MKKAGKSVMRAMTSGLLIMVPVYLSVLVIVKMMKAVSGLARPIVELLPPWFPGEGLLSLVIVFMVCVLVGLIARTAPGRSVGASVERSFFERIPGYTVFRGMTRQTAGKSQANAWKPALVEIEEALVPAFIVETLPDGQHTVFVPSSPTPLAGAVYVLTPDRVHPVDVSFAKAIKSITRWGEGTEALVAAMKKE